FPPTNRSDHTHEEFADELAHIISPPEYDCFYFRDLLDPGELISIFNSGIRENLFSTTCVNLLVEDNHYALLTYVVWIFLAYLTYLVIPLYLHPFEIEDTIFDPGITINRFHSFKPGLSHRDLPDLGELMSVLNSEIRKNLSSTTSVNLPIEDDHSPLLTYVVWIFVAYLTYPVIPLYLHPFENEDTIFDPGITINHFYSFKPGLSHRYRAFKKLNTHRSHLNEWQMIINGNNTPILDVLLFHFYPP
nr:hypothetical protein [Tanacetum cinerariifolium]